MDPIGLGVVEENEIFRRGLIACLEGDAALRTRYAGAEPDAAADVQIVIASASAAERFAFRAPLVVCSDVPLRATGATSNAVLGLLPRSTLTSAQLINGVRAVASGLSVNMLDPGGGALSDRNLAILRMLADGAATRQIAEELGYSERTIKHAVAELLQELGAHSRAEAVALGMRRGLL